MYSKAVVVAMCVEVILMASVCNSAANPSCPAWSSYSTKYSTCICSPSIELYITCSQETKESFLNLGVTIGYKNDTVALVSYIPYIFPRHTVDHKMLQINLTNMSATEARKTLCTSLNRNSDNNSFCGRCKHNFGPAVYSFGLQCVKCNVELGLIKYTALQILPITLFYFAVLIFKVDLTRPNMFHYVVFCNVITFMFRYSAKLCMSYLYASVDLLSGMMKVGLTLSGVWCLDFLRFVVPPFCFNKLVHDCMVPFFDFFPAVYLLVLTVIIAGLIKLHRYRLKPILRIWSPFQKLLVYCKLNQDPVEAIVHTYANFFFLYFAKTVSVFTLTLKTTSAFLQDSSIPVERQTLFYDPTKTYYDRRHISIVMVVLVVASILVLPALLLLVVFHTSPFQRFYQARVGRGWQKILRIFVTTLENGYKDGSNETRDYRALGGGYFMLIILWLAMILLLLRNIKYNNDLQWPVIYSGFILMTVMYGSLRPYKKRSSNNMAVFLYATLIVIVNLVCFLDLRTARYYYTQRRGMLIFIMFVVLTVNIVYTVYITQKIIIYFVTRERAAKWAETVRRLCRCPCNCTEGEEEQEGLLHNPGPPGNYYH